MTRDDFKQLRNGTIIWLVSAGAMEASIRAVLKRGDDGVGWPDDFGGAEFRMSPKTENCFLDYREAARELVARLAVWKADAGSLEERGGRSVFCQLNP